MTGHPGGMMNRHMLAFVLAVLFCSSLVAFPLPAADAADLASNANIYMYSKPFKIGDLALLNSRGQRVSLKDYRGRVVLVHFWSISCPACKVEAPLLDWLKKTYGPAGLEILGVNLVDPPASVVNYATKTNCCYPVLCTDGKSNGLQTVRMGGKTTSFLINDAKEAILEIPGLPTTYIVDCRGDAVAYSVGPATWNHASAQGLIRKLLAESKTCRLDDANVSQNLGSMW